MGRPASSPKQPGVRTWHGQSNEGRVEMNDSLSASSRQFPHSLAAAGQAEAASRTRASVWTLGAGLVTRLLGGHYAKRQCWGKSPEWSQSHEDGVFTGTRLLTCASWYFENDSDIFDIMCYLFCMLWQSQDDSKKKKCCIFRGVCRELSCGCKKHQIFC